MKYNQANENLALSIEKLPLTVDMVPLYLNILETTDNAIIRGEIAIKLIEICPNNDELKNTLVALINSHKTDGYKGGLLYALMSMDYSDNESIDMLCCQLVEGNYECMHKAFHMLFDIADTINEEKRNRIIKYFDKTGEILGERLDLIEELYNYLDGENINTGDGSVC